MGLFGGKNKMSDNEAKARELLDKQLKKELTDAQFLREFAKLEILYTTPAGDTAEGKMKFFLIPGPPPTAYMPLFLNEAEMKKFYDQAGRKNFLILKGTILDVMKVCISQNKKDDMNFHYGLMIDPWTYKVTLDAPVLETVVRMINGEIN